MIAKSTHYKLCDKNGIILQEGNKQDMNRRKKPGTFVTQTWKDLHVGDYIGFVPQPITAEDVKEFRKSAK